MNKLDIFEKGIKKVLENYEMQNDSGAWEAFAPGLAGIVVAGKSFISNFVLSGAIVGGMFLFINLDFENKHANSEISDNVIDTKEVLSNSAQMNTEQEISFDVAEQMMTESSSSASSPDHVVVTKSTDRKGKLSERAPSLNLNEPTRTTRYVGKNFKLNAPLSFTPNDDGNSDSFMPNALRAEDRFKLFVYNSNNELVFKSIDITHAWDGTNDITHEKAPAGKYNWRVELVAKNRKNLFEGKVQLIR